ncbi:uncharacterized protein N7458_004236 [Penicillium daleae]|uniref:Uncharacterized protein n=1 Tax=Penicillium daleae TaxID=63821 RepID=A0AAD6CC59_9EURO|nr:uncharacterized protein N7458_004236 [Penicillium daleae]KAJ5455972.1 hypothetical protein N7458_004236 [Penicillium daleae]
MRELFSVLRTGFGMLRMEEVRRRANNTTFVEVEPTSYELLRDFRVSTRQMFTNDYRWLKSMGTKLWANPLNHKATDFGLTNPPSALETLRTSGVAMGPGAS